MKIVVSPNPYRDKQFKHARQACQILKEAGAEVSLCLPFDVDRSFEIPSDLRFREIQKEIRTADMLICFGGDGTILHSSKIATEHGLPILGVNIGTMGFIAELEASEMELLRKIPQGDYTVEPRTMLDVSVVSGKPPAEEPAQQPPAPPQREPAPEDDALNELLAFGEQFDNIVIQ